MPEEPNIYAAHALSANVFCVAMGVLEYDDQFSMILSYDGSFPQPWSRVDVDREITSVTQYFDQERSETVYAALSSEGDIYFIGDTTNREKIVGPGFNNQESSNLGPVRKITNVGKRLFVCGHKSQVYQRAAPDRWYPFGDVSLTPEAGYDHLIFESMAGSSPSDIYVCGNASPKSAAYSDAQREEMLRAHREGDLARFGELRRQVKEIPRDPAGCAFHWNGEEWSSLPLPNSAILKDIYVESSDRIWMVGSEGTILLGNSRDGFKDLSFDGDTELLTSITEFHGERIITSSRGLYKFDGHILSRLKPLIRAGAPSPLRTQAVDGVLWYFDYHRVISRFDGENWEMIPIPRELMERDFKGLRPRAR